VALLLDTDSGKEIAVLEITKGVDDMVFDPASKRLYASCDGDADVYSRPTPTLISHSAKFLPAHWREPLYSCLHLFDSKSGRLLNSQVILVKEEKILAVGAADTVQIPPDAQIIPFVVPHHTTAPLQAGA
jgi:hypothetical protein